MCTGVLVVAAYLCHQSSETPRMRDERGTKMRVFVMIMQLNTRKDMIKQYHTHMTTHLLISMGTKAQCLYQTQQ